MDFVSIIGCVAGMLTTIAFVPQVIKTYQTKTAKDLSLSMFLIFFAGVCLWTIYGIIKNDIPIVLTNCATLTLSGALLYFKLTFKD